MRKVGNQNGPGLLFENITDYQNTLCRKLTAHTLGSRKRVALALALAPDSSYREITPFLRERFREKRSPVALSTGPVKSNVISGDDVDLYQFPAPRWHEGDGGRYFLTAAGLVTMDPETKIMNVGVYRGMVCGKKGIAVLTPETQHSGKHFSCYRALGKEMPVAVVLGWDPIFFMTAATPVRHPGYSEYEIMGALRRQPVELVKCETSDLMVPANAEIVLEGKISPDPATFEMEGPFGEYPGYFGGQASPKPVIRVECITFRNDPIFMGTLEGQSPGKLDEGSYFTCASMSAVAWNLLDDIGVPNVTGVWCKPVVAGTNLRVQVRKIYRGHAKQVANAVWGAGYYLAKNLVVVDDDIDIFDDDAVEWAVAWRTNAAMGDFAFFPGTFGSPLDPSVPLKERDVLKYGQGKWTRVLIDATINWDLEAEEQYGGKRYPPLSTDIDSKTEKKLLSRWKEYGI
ncbi:MAG: UbiD family decarboxylase [Deltaproteobacteria bacterium]|nr:UbiD family decarboxylase [Deltaproteobacteria bacterium]